MRREDALLSQGVKLVVLRDDAQHYLRLLAPKGGTNTFFTPKLPLLDDERESLLREERYRLDVGPLTVVVIGTTALAILGDLNVMGPRRALSDALLQIAR